MKKKIIYQIKRLIGKSFNQKEINEETKYLPFTSKKDKNTDLLKIELTLNNEAEKEEKINELKKKNEININNDTDINTNAIKEENEIIINPEIKDENEKIINNEININDEIKGKKEIIIEFYPEEIYSLLLEKIIKDSEYYLTKKIGKNIKINNCVLTIPANYNQKQREATKNTAKILGLNVKGLINEPTAAILPYVYKNVNSVKKHIVVIDFGGGTLDLTLLKLKKDEEEIYCDILSTYGDTNLGGEDFDKILMEKFIKYCEKNYSDLTNMNEDWGKNKLHNIRLKKACERAKRRLTDFKHTVIHIENYLSNKSIKFSITKEDFNKYCKILFTKFEKIIDKFLELSEIEKKKIKINEIILIGGSSQIPKIKEIIKYKFKDSEIKSDLDPKEVVAMGAAIRGANYLNLPSVKNIKLFDVINLSLGILLSKNKFKKIIKRNSKIPDKKINFFGTAYDNQDFGRIEIYEGEEDEKCKENNLLLGKFNVINLSHKKAGEVEIKVKFEIDENSILEVTAWEVDNKENTIKSIKIEKTYELDIKKLKDRVNQISFLENEEYNKIKFSIIESEEELNKQENKENKENIKILNKKLIEKIGKFLIEVEEISYLYVPIIKYYFNKLCEFYQIYSLNNIDNLNTFKDDIYSILEKIQTFNSDLIFEIIEEFIDIDYLYENCIESILNGYWNKINLMFISTKPLMEEYEISKYDNALKILSETKRLVNLCAKKFDQFSKNLTKYLKFTKKDLKNFEMKIKVRENIIEGGKKNVKYEFLSMEIDSLKDLYQEYTENDNYDIEDLEELSFIVGELLINQEDYKKYNIEKYNNEFKKDITFLKWIRKKNEKNTIDKDDFCSIIKKILSDYPYCKGEKKEEKMWKDYYDYKSEIKSFEDYLFRLKGEYQDLLSVEDKDIKKDIYKGIQIFLNNCQIWN